MAATVIVGGQYGSEGKGKVAHLLARDRSAAAVVRVGGPNSGHTVAALEADRPILRQLPTAAVLDNTLCMLGPGSYVDPQLLLDEIERIGLDRSRLLIDENAVLVTDDDREAERESGLGERIGSTCSGTGAAVIKRAMRRARSDLAVSSEVLADLVGDVPLRLRELLTGANDVIVEGTQGFGLSLLHSREFPNATSRDTSAAGAMSEAGLSPRDIGDVVLVVRAFPIRVAGESGDFGSQEIDWETIAYEGGHEASLTEYTSVTRRERRVARFDPEIVRRAIAINQPSIIVLNHVDYVDAACTPTRMTEKAAAYVQWVEDAIGQKIDLVGLGPDALTSRRQALAQVA